MKSVHIFAENVDGTALSQFYDAMKQDFVVAGALMPDAHAGYSLPIGAVVATEGVVVPAWVGYDIGCGMCALPTTFAVEDVKNAAEAIFQRIYEDIPVGRKHNDKHAAWAGWQTIPCTDHLRDIFEKRGGLRQLCSLGGGNHFIEIGADENVQVWSIVHSGSRGVGHGVATYYMREASMLHTGVHKAREGHFGLNVLSAQGKAYITDMEFCLQFALANRRKMVERVEMAMRQFVEGRVNWSRLINRNHNHAEERNHQWIHRKGATHAEAGMMGVIPGNMRDGCFIVEGKGNPHALWSSAHGAGRVLGRKVAKEALKLEDFEVAMIGVQARVNAGTLDESPFAYKDLFEVMRLQEDLVTVKNYVQPIINIKG